MNYKRQCVIAAIAFSFTGLNLISSVYAAPPIDKEYIKSLAAPGKKVAVIEYYDGQGVVVDRKGFTSKHPWKVASPTEFYVSNKHKLNLFGIQPCAGELVVKYSNYVGNCDSYAQQELEIMLRDPKVLFCRAFISEQNAPSQDATCYGYYIVPGALDTVDMLEEQLVSLGALKVSQKPNGNFVREDLQEAEKIGKQRKFGMWADHRTANQ